MLIYLGFVTTTYLIFEGDQVWRVTSSLFPIYTKNKRASYTSRRIVVHHHRPSRALANGEAVSSLTDSLGLQHIKGE